MEVHSGCYEIWLIVWSNFGAAETSAQLCRRLSAVFSQQWFSGFHNHKAFRVSDSSLSQSQDLLHHNMACIIYLSFFVYTYCQCGCRWNWSINAGRPGDVDWENLEMHLEAEIKRVGRCTWSPRSCNYEMHLEAVIERVWRCTWRPRSSWTQWCTWRPRSSQLGEAFGGRDHVTQRCTWMPRSSWTQRCTWRPW